MVYKVTEETINGIANAIRTKTNSEEEIQVQDFAAAILNIETGENTASAAQSAKNAEASAISAASNAQFAKESAELAAESIELVIASAGDVIVSATAVKESEEKIEKNLDYTIDLVQNLEGFNSEAWAVGTRNGAEVGSNDSTYQNNSKHWSDVAKDAVMDFQSKVDLINVFATATVLEEE